MNAAWPMEKPTLREFVVVSIGQMVSATSEAGRAAATAVVGVGDGIAGGVVGGVSGVVVGASEGLGLHRLNGASAVVTAAVVGAGIVGLVDWPVLALVGGAVLLVSQLRGRPRLSTGEGTASLGTRPADKTITKGAEPPAASQPEVKKATAKRATPRKTANGRAASPTSSDGSAAAVGRARAATQ